MNARLRILDSISKGKRGHWRFESRRLTGWRHAGGTSRRMWLD